MGIDKQSDIAANLQIGPTTLGMVRIYLEADGVELPLDFDPEEAEEIAEELRSAADAAVRPPNVAAGHPWALFVSASGSFWPPKAAADCQTLSFSASFYKIRWGKNHPKST